MGGALSSATPDTRLSLAAAIGRPVTPAAQRLLTVAPALAELFPDGGLRRGSTVSLNAGAGATSLALALTVPVTAAGSWVAAVGLSSLGLVAAAQMGAVLDRMALVPAAGTQWPVVAAALLDSVDLLLLAPTARVRPEDARRLTARARERGAVLVVLAPLESRAGRWPEAADVVLTVDSARWDGLETGAGHLQARILEVVATGRRAAGRPRRRTIWLPDREGRITIAPTAGVAGVAGVAGATERSGEAAGSDAGAIPMAAG